ncbi:MAG TPA: membrane dipeptidase [Gaiellaceae bacterium]
MILDGHNDLVDRLWTGKKPMHIDLANAGEVGFAGGFFALWASGGRLETPRHAPYSLPLDPPLEREQARLDVEEQAMILEALDVTIVKRVEEIVPGRVNAIMHIEGAEPLAPDLSDLESWFQRGLRSIGIVWSRPNAFGSGVPFAFPGSPDTGPGLTQAGHDLVQACNLLGIVVDVSHLNEAGFWDVARHTQAPIVATHSNAHALCASTRNLTDAQLDAIGASGGVVGVNFGPMFLREDGEITSRTPLSEIVRHVDYIATRIGVEHVAFGSDFDGVNVPRKLGGIAGLPRLLDALRKAGYDGEALERITHGNWLRVLEETWKPWGRYFRLAGLDARPTLLDAVERFAVPGFAVDLGAGTGRDTLELLRRGWRVLSIDKEADAVDRLQEHAGEGAQLETRVARFEDASWPACDLLNASFTLPFCPPAEFPRLWARVVDSIVAGGRFAGQLFGERDEWARTGLTIHTRAEVEELLAPFEVELFDEFEGEGPTVIGKTKHWHVFHVAGRKR